ncbi:MULTISPECIES: DUF1272 domain-containing protein [unclassified Microcoleus]|uniref:DUF1272 domain-containing protein n=1 Tax=unclassified Microcoleus TaxID=2642155 RepID=UPI00403F7F0C
MAFPCSFPCNFWQQCTTGRISNSSENCGGAISTRDRLLNLCKPGKTNSIA